MLNQLATYKRTGQDHDWLWFRGRYCIKVNLCCCRIVSGHSDRLYSLLLSVWVEASIIKGTYLDRKYRLWLRWNHLDLSQICLMLCIDRFPLLKNKWTTVMLQMDFFPITSLCGFSNLLLLNLNLLYSRCLLRKAT